MVEEAKTTVLKEKDTEVATTENLQISEKIKVKKISPFVSTRKEWENYSIPAEIMRGLKDGAGWERPSKI
jgi:hypothetical protein